MLHLYSQQIFLQNKNQTFFTPCTFEFVSYTLFIVHHSRLGKSQVAAENPNTAFPKQELWFPILLSHIYTHSAVGIHIFPSHVLMRSSHFAPWSSPGEVRSNPQTMQGMCRPSGQPSTAPGLTRASFFQLPQTELILEGQTAP